MLKTPNPQTSLEALEPRQLLSSVAVNNAVTYQTITAMGAAMNTSFTPTEYSDPNFINSVVNDLGASGFRFAIPPTFEKANDDNDPNHINWAGYDMAAIEQPMRFLQELKARGVKTFLATVWSPPWWMKTNSSQVEGGMLRPDMRQEFAEYLAAFTLAAKNNYGIDITAIAPQNEPFFVEPYPSAFYNPSQLREALRATMRMFTKYGLKTQFAPTEELIYPGRNKWYMDAIMNDPETKLYPGPIAGHGVDFWDEYKEKIAPYHKTFWQTEMSGFSATWNGAMATAEGISNALSRSDAAVYFYWQISELSGGASKGLMVNGKPTPKYYAAKQYYRYIRPGMVRVSATTTDPNLRLAAFRNPANGAMTIVLINKDTVATDVNFTLSGTNLPTSYKQVRSTETENAVPAGTVTGGPSIKLNMPARSIVTLYSGPDLVGTNLTTAMPKVAVPWVWDPSQVSSLQGAALKGDLNALKAEIAKGANVNQKGATGWTALHFAASCSAAWIIDATGKKQIVSPVELMNALIAAGADVNAVTNEGFTPLHIVAMNPIPRWGVSFWNPIDRINRLIDAGAKVNATDGKLRTPLHWAAMMGHVWDTGPQDPALVNALLLRGANANATDISGKTPAAYAAVESATSVVNALNAFNANHTQTPFYGDPTRILDEVGFEAENFDNGGEGFSFHDTDAANAGNIYRPTAVDLKRVTDGTSDTFAVVAKAGEWLEYSTTFDVNRTYDITFRVASAVAGGKFHLEVDGVNKTGTLTVPNTGGDNTWADVIKTDVAFTKGAHTLRLVFDSAVGAALGNFNSVKLTPKLGPPPAGTQKPFKGTPFSISSSSAVTIQAEDFDEGGELVSYHDVDTSNLGGSSYRTSAVDIQDILGGGYNLAYTRNGEWLEYTVNVVNDANYDFAFRVANSVTGGTFHVDVDGVNATGTLAVPGTGSSTTYTTVTKTGVHLLPGQHMLRLALNAPSATTAVGNFDWFSIAKSGTQPPPTGTQTPFKGTPFSITRSATTTIQFEDFDNGGEAVAYHDSDTANSGGAYRSTGVDLQGTTDTGGGYNIGWTRAGEWLEYTINVATAGNYDLSFRIASAGSNGLFHAEIGGVNKTGSLAVPNTAGSQNWTTSKKTSVALAAGQQVLRVAFDQAGTSGAVGNFNYLTIAPSVSTPAPVHITNTTSTYVQDGATYADTNFGTLTNLLVKKNSTVGVNRETYLKFDLSSVSAITSAKLRLYGHVSSTQNATVRTSVFSSTNTTWNESTLTWNSRPLGTGTTALATITLGGTAEQWYEWDVTSYLKAEKAAGRNIVTLVLKNPDSSAAASSFNSDDSATNRPELLIS